MKKQALVQILLFISCCQLLSSIEMKEIGLYVNDIDIQINSIRFWENNYYIVGEHEYIIKIDHTKHTQLLSGNKSGMNFKDITFLNDKTFILADSSLVIELNNVFKTNYKHIVETKSPLKKIVSINDYLVVINQDGDIFYSQNGANWNTLDIEYKANDLLINDNSLFITTNQGIILEFTEFPNSQKNILVQQNLDIKGIYISNNKIAVCGNSNKAYYSIDGGNNFSEIIIPSNVKDINSIALFQDSVFFIGYANGIIKSNDFGLTWKSFISSWNPIRILNFEGELFVHADIYFAKINYNITSNIFSVDKYFEQEKYTVGSFAVSNSKDEDNILYYNANKIYNYSIKDSIASIVYKHKFSISNLWHDSSNIFIVNVKGGNNSYKTTLTRLSKINFTICDSVVLNSTQENNKYVFCNNKHYLYSYGSSFYSYSINDSIFTEHTIPDSLHIQQIEALKDTLVILTYSDNNHHNFLKYYNNQYSLLNCKFKNQSIYDFLVIDWQSLKLILNDEKDCNPDSHSSNSYIGKYMLYDDVFICQDSIMNSSRKVLNGRNTDINEYLFYGKGYLCLQNDNTPKLEQYLFSNLSRILDLQKKHNDYYGLVDFKLCKIELNTNSIESKFQEKNNISIVFPNPLSQNKSLNIIFNSEQKINDIKISIIDMSGKIIDGTTSFCSQSNLQYTPETPLSPGTYFIVISSNGELLGREKFVVVE